MRGKKGENGGHVLREKQCAGGGRRRILKNTAGSWVCLLLQTYCDTYDQPIKKPQPYV